MFVVPVRVGDRLLGGVAVRRGGVVVVEAGGGGGGGEEGQGPFPAEAEEAEEEVDGLEDGDGADGGVEVRGQEVPEEFWPEEGADRGGDLVCEGCWLVGWGGEWGLGGGRATYMRRR